MVRPSGETAKLTSVGRTNKLSPPGGRIEKRTSGLGSDGESVQPATPAMTAATRALAAIMGIE